MRSQKRLNEIRKLPCIRCGKPPPSEACHANWSEYGKSLGKKASDEFTISLCRTCHYSLDTYKDLSREEAKALFGKLLDKTNRMLNVKNDDQDEVF